MTRAEVAKAAGVRLDIVTIERHDDVYCERCGVPFDTGDRCLEANESAWYCSVSCAARSLGVRS